MSIVSDPAAALKPNELQSMEHRRQRLISIWVDLIAKIAEGAVADWAILDWESIDHKTHSMTLVELLALPQKTHSLPLWKLAAAFNRIFYGETEVYDTVVAKLAKSLSATDADRVDFDLESADVLIQVALFGEIVYG